MKIFDFIKLVKLAVDLLQLLLAICRIVCEIIDWIDTNDDL